MDVQKTAQADYDRCEALNRQGQPCRNRAGKGTSHLGLGRCRYHGGASQVIHGQRARTPALRRHYARHNPELRDLVAEYQKDPDPFNALEEIAILRALIQRALERMDDEPNGSSSENVIPALVDRLSRIISRIERARAKGAVSTEELSDLVNRLALIVKYHVKDPKTLEAIAEDWGSQTLRP